jgi:drug/metabolite transporter (DMT)-like permease
VTTRRDVRIGLLFAAGAAILYGAAYPATALALRSYTPLGIAALACTLALPVVITLSSLGWLPRPQVDGLDRPRLLRLGILSGLGGLLFIAATNVAVALSGPTITGFVAPLYAVGAALLAVPILGERVRPAALVAFGVALLGTGLLAGGAPDLDSLVGIAMGLLAAIIFALYLVLARRWSTRYRLDGTLVTIANLASRGPVLLVIEAIRAPGTLLPADADPVAVVALLTIAFGSSSTANLLLMASVRRVPAARTSAALLLTPVSSAVLGALLLRDRLEPVQLVGAVLVLLGIGVASGAIAALLGARRGGPVATTPDPPALPPA